MTELTSYPLFFSKIILKKCSMEKVLYQTKTKIVISFKFDFIFEIFPVIILKFPKIHLTTLYIVVYYIFIHKI